MGAVAIGAMLFALLLVIGAAMVWQEARSAAGEAQPTYLLDEASRFVFDRLPGDADSRLGVDDVKAILEWGLYHSQVIIPRDEESPPVIGGEAAVAFVAERAVAESGDPYHRDDVETVLALETEYLVEIGAIGDPVEEDVT